jgi:type I restriction enzyme S subunit
MNKSISWTSIQLGEVCRLRGGSGFKPALQGRSDGEFPFIKVSDFNAPGNEVSINGANNWVDAADRSTIQGHSFPAGATVFAKIGEALKHNRKRFLTRPTYIDNNLMAAVAEPDIILPEFLFHLLRTIDIAASDVGTAIPYVKASTLEKISIKIPPLETQRRIASILWAYDDLLGVNRQRATVLEEMVRGMFEEWFVRFRFPGHEGVPILDTPDGRLPEGWCRPAISTVYDGMYDGPHATPPLAEAGATFLGIGNITETGRIDLSSLRYIADDDLAKWTKRVTPQEGDIVFTYEATLNRYALIPKGFRGCLGRRLALIRCNSRPGMNRYLYHYFFTQDWREVIAKNTLAGATVDRVPLTRFPEFPITVPPSELLHRFDEIAQPIAKQTEAIEASNRLLEASRDLLLPRLISGQLSVVEAERSIKEAA